MRFPKYIFSYSISVTDLYFKESTQILLTELLITKFGKKTSKK